MTKQVLKIQSHLSLLLSVAVGLSGLVVPAFSQQEKPVVISFGQPNIWSLEQAHYLLARMHRQNLDLQTATLGDLDPNATNASRIDILKTLLEAGVKYDQAVALNNQLLKGDKTFNSQRRQELLSKRSSLQGESTQLSRDIAALKIAKAEAKTDDDRVPIQAQIDAKTEEKAAVDNDLSQTNTELQGLTSASGNFTSAEPSGSFNSDSLKGDLDALISKVQLINPSIAATLRLDNHIQMQYEIIAKQLTLLRDEVGPGERLVFLELPQSINATQDKAENRVAQTWWRIAGYTRVDKEKQRKHEQEELGKKIAQIDIDRRDNGALQEKYQKNKDQLTAQLKSLCSDKATREAEVVSAKRRLEEAKKEKEDADQSLSVAQKAKEAAAQELADAKELRNEAEKELARARKLRNKTQLRLAVRKVSKAETAIALANEHAERAEQQGREAEAKRLRAVAYTEELCADLVRNIDLLNGSVGQIDKTIKETQEAIQGVDDRQIKLQRETTKLAQAFTALATKFERLTLDLSRKKIKEQQGAADRLLQGGGANTSDIVSKTIELLDQAPTRNLALGFQKAEYGNLKDEKGREYSLKDDGPESEGRAYVNLDQFPVAAANRDKLINGQPLSDKRPVLRNRAVRTLDIIPRQNAVNVNDTKERISKTGIFAALSFLFGFGGKLTYERQHEQAEQFLNQELFTSGFGKGETDFGWTFYPFAGTKVLAPGVRTTYAVAIIPKDAETLVLKAKGCYFPRKDNQPLNYDMAGSSQWPGSGSIRTASCTQDEQVFVLPVPGGSGDGADFYVTGMWYTGQRKAGDRMVASIYGQNFPTQVGVLVNGVPLSQAVGLAQTAVESNLGDRVKDNCVGQICGRFERIDSNQIVISFNMPGDFKQTPSIALIGPGKEVELNKLNLSINGADDTQLDSAEWMFGRPATEASRVIADFKVAPAATPNFMTGVLSGGKFKPTDTIFVNGTAATTKSCPRKDLCILTFPVQSTDSLTVTVSPQDEHEDAVSRTFVNPTTLSIISSSIVSYDKGDATHKALLTVRLDGSGFRNTLDIAIDGADAGPVKLVSSSGQMILGLSAPGAVVKITLTDPDNNKFVSTVVVRPE